jgi:alkylation response protein AidB-like acyl-CoA dehydrogenase
MDFGFSQEQQLLHDTLVRFVDQEYSFESRRARVKSEEGFGLLGVPIPERYGGFGGSALDVMIVMEQFGRGLVVEPYLATVILGGQTIVLGGSDAQKAALLPRIATGELLLSVAYGEPQARYQLENVETSAHPDGDRYLLNGSKSVVPQGAAADLLIVPARTAGAARDRQGITLFLVDRNTPGLTVRGYATIDGLRAAELRLKDVRVGAEDVVGEVRAGFPLLERVADLGVAALCAEAVGIMSALNAATLEYLKTRQQFGVPIGRFQVLQHRMADMLIQYEQAKSMGILAAVKADSGDPSERRRAISAAKVQVGRSGRFIGQQAVQLHGAMGMTDELNVSHYFKRLSLIDSTLGDTDHHLARFAEAA